MQKIIPHLWFDKQAEEAVRFYTSVFRGGSISNTTYYPEAGREIHGMEAGTVLTVEFEIEGYSFIALNGGPHFTPNPSISFMVNFDPSKDTNAKENLDQVWEKLSDGGAVLMPLETYPFSERYGWVQDKYGLSWQLILTDPEEEERPPIIPSFLFVTDGCDKAEEATDFYLSVFTNSPSGSGQTKRGVMARYPAGMEPNKEGAVMFTDFQLGGQWFAAMDGSARMHDFNFTEAISLLVKCKTQEEIDHLWENLSAVPEAEQCGWLKDKYGVSWQIVPTGMEKMLNDPDKERANRVMEAMLKMKKMDLMELERVY